MKKIIASGRFSDAGDLVDVINVLQRHDLIEPHDVVRVCYDGLKLVEYNLVEETLSDGSKAKDLILS